MNHRELILCAGKKAKHHFLRLPEDLQDAIVEGLDSQSLTLQEASTLAKAKGHPLSHEAIAGYYRALRVERGLDSVRQSVARITEEFAGKQPDENLTLLSNLIVGHAIAALADGSVRIKDIDLGKVLQALGGKKPPGDASATEAPPEATSPAAREEGRPRVSSETIEAIRRDIYGF